MKHTKFQLVFLLTCIALLWIDTLNPPRAASRQSTLTIGSNGG